MTKRSIRRKFSWADANVIKTRTAKKPRGGLFASFLTLIRQGQGPLPLLLLFRASHIVGKDIKNVVTVSPQPQKQAHNEISNT
jgi:hypothetical protein